MFPGKGGIFFTLHMLEELDLAMASSSPTVALFWQTRCSERYSRYRHDEGYELGHTHSAQLYQVRHYLNLAYLDFI